MAINKLGIHTLSSFGPTLTFLREMKDRGRPVPIVLVVGLDGAHEIKAVSPETVVVIRFPWQTEEWQYGAERQDYNPRARALAWWNDWFFRARLDQLREADYILFQNEADYPPSPLLPDPFLGYRNFGLTAIELGELAYKNGLRMAHLGLNAGTPAWQDLQALKASGLFEHIALRRGALVFHEGVFGDGTPVDALWPWTEGYDSRRTDEQGHPVDLAHLPAPYMLSPHAFPATHQPGALNLRYRALYEGLGIDKAKVPAIIGEWYGGGGHDQDWPGNSDEGNAFVMNNLGRIAWYNGQLNQDSYVIGFCPFTIGGPGWANSQMNFLYDPHYWQDGNSGSAAGAWASTLDNLPVSQPVPVPELPPPPPVTVPKAVRVTGNVTLRDAPGMAARRLTYLAPDTIMPVLDYQGGWVQVSLRGTGTDSTPAGWLYLGKYVQPT